MPASVAEFVKAAENSGILTAESLAEYVQYFAPDSDAATLASRLVEAGRLTAFQAEHIYGGKADSLVIGPYVVLDVIGKGGMGSVYKAEHRRMRRVVALKVIAKTALESPTAVQRFEREAQAAARLEHPNIVTAFDAGEAGGTHYLVMQFVEGRNLSEVVRKRGPQPVGRVVDWMLQAARGLAYAHGKDVVHRDIKPSNLLMAVFACRPAGDGPSGHGSLPHSPLRRGEVTNVPDERRTPRDTPPPPAVVPFDAVQARSHQEAWARHLGIEVVTTNSIGQILVVIPSGRFTIGTSGDTADITATDPFLLAQTEVTQGQWKEVMGTNPWKGERYTIEGTDVAATYVSWDDAVAFCAALTEREHGSGMISREQQYRLPTEAEWEFACRAGTVTQFSFGDDEGLIGDYAWFGSGWRDGPIPGGNTSGEPYAHAVGLKKPNSFGLFDVHGNAWEWVAHGRGLVNRGGSWSSAAQVCRSAYRLGGAPSSRNASLGFRVALSLPGAKPHEAAAGD